MPRENRQRVLQLYNSALQREPSQRSAFLAEVCKDDEQLRHDVELLLGQMETVDDVPHEQARAAAANIRTSTTIAASSILAEPRRENLGPLFKQQTVLHYRIQEEIGRGGMGVVYRARDDRLRRDVAIKLLRFENQNLRQRALLLGETRAAAALNHPGVVTVYDIGEHEGAVFLVMELVAGEPLRSLLDAGALDPSRILQMGAEIAEALGVAHSAGILHGDVKPANIIVQADGRIKLLDFGIARHVIQEHATATLELGDLDASSGRFTGTVPYMAPEQVRGEGWDLRTDLYALGVVLYEMAAGHRPFRAPTAAALVHQILMEPPPPLPTPPGFPDGLARAVSKLLEKKREDRYSSTADLAADLKNTLQRREILSMASGAVHGRRSVAVLPFRLLTPLAEDQYLSVALADAVANLLGADGSLVVRPVSSVLRYAQESADWSAAARELNVDVLVDGSIQKLGQRIRVHVQAHQIGEAAPLVSDKHEGEMLDLFGLQDRIGDSLVNALGSHRKRTSSRGEPPTANPLAYELYLRAADRMAHLSRWGTLTSIEMLNKATALDPQFADAWARLAEVHLQMGVLFENSPRWFRGADIAIQSALELDPNNADAQCARGQFLWTPANQFQNRLALRALNSALRLNPGCHQAQIWRGAILNHIGLFDEAKTGLAEALAKNPDDVRTLVFLGTTAQYRGNYDESYAFFSRALAIDPTNLWGNLFFPGTLVYQGKLALAAEKIKVARQMLPEELSLASVEAVLLAREGQNQSAEELAEQALKSGKPMLHTHHIWHYAADVFAMTGKTSRALALLRKCAAMGLPNAPLFGSDPHLKSLHAHRGFLELMSGLNRELNDFSREFGARATKTA